MKIVLRLGQNFMIFVNWHTGVSKLIEILQFWFQQVNWKSFLHILWKFGGIQITDPGVLGERSCMAGVDNCCHA